MNILGINFGHDSSACFIQDGKLKICIEEEKLSRKKSELGYPEQAVAYILNQFKLGENHIDIVAFGGNSYNLYGKHNISERLFKKKIDRYQDLLQRILSFYKIRKHDVGEQNKEYFIKLIQNKGFSNAQIFFYKHHLAHAASAYFHAPFEADLVITCDGHGDGEAFNFYIPDKNKNLVLKHSNNYETSIGQFFSVVTTFLGFKPNRHEGKIMELAAFGSYTMLCDDMKSLFCYENSMLKRFPYNGFEEKLKFAIQKKWVSLKNLMGFQGLNLIGQHYSLNKIILNQWLIQNTEGYSKEDVAFAIQNCTEHVVLNEIKRFISIEFPNKKIKIAVAGGVFANVKLNQHIKELLEVENIFIQPAMSDLGLSLGAGMLATNEIYKKAHFQPIKNSFLGANYESEIEPFINYIKIKHKEIIVNKSINNTSEITDYLIENKIIGFYTNSMEWGPRALGHRSIIANTFRKEVNQELNKRLNRTEFMPFAPSIIDFMADEYLHNYDTECAASQYMTVTYDVKKEYHDLLQAVVHVDGTCRPHIVFEDLNSFYYSILKDFYNKTGCGAFVNTSFNVHEEPIVNKPEVAFKALLDNRIDILVLENYILKKG